MAITKLNTTQVPVGGGGTAVWVGSAEVDFGAFPGQSDASLDVTGQTSILSGSIVRAWIMPKDTVDHLADEHMVETIQAFAANIVAGTGFTLYVFNTNQITENPEGPRHLWYPQCQGQQPTIYGKWTVGWTWV